MTLLVDQCQITGSATSGIYSGSSSAKLVILQSLFNQNGNLGLSGSIKDLTISQTQVNNNQNGGVNFTSQSGVFVATDNCQFNDNSGNGIKSTSGSMTLTDVEVLNNSAYGVYFSYGSVTIDQSQIGNNQSDGIYLANGYTTTKITQCQIFNNDKGIKVYPSSSTSQKISNNTIQSNRSDGIYINYSRTGIEISNNQIKSNNGHGIYLDNTTNYTSNRLQLVDNIISQNNEGIHAYRSHFNADNNTISYNQSYAIYSYSSSANVSVTGCLITQNGKGICKNNSGSFNVSNCTISQNSDYAIKSIYATATIQNNVIASNQVGSAVVDLTDNASSKLEYNLIYNNVSSNADATAIHLDGTITCQYNSIRNNQTTYDLHFSGANTW